MVLSVPIVAFLFGLLLGSYLSVLPLTITILLIILAGILSGFEHKALVSVSHGLMIYACILFGVGYWVLDDRTHASADFLSSMDRREVTISGIVATPVSHGPDRVTMLVAVQSGETDGTRRLMSGNLRLTWRKPDTEVFRGDTITVRARLRSPFGVRNPGGFDYGLYLRERGIHAVATVKGPNQIQVRPPGVLDVGARMWRQIDQWRNQVRQAAISTLGQPARGLFLGMIVGEQADIPPRVRDDFMTTGTVHIISISGSHLGLLAVLSFFSVRRIARRMPSEWLEKLSCVLTPKQLAILVTIPMVVFYTLLSGAHVATVRSLMMILLYLFAMWIGYERHIIIALSLAAFLTTLANPKAIHDLSFQLSYVSVLAIALGLRWSRQDKEEPGILPRIMVNEYKGNPFMVRIRRYFAILATDFQSMKEQCVRRGRQYMVMTLSVTLATVPLVAYYFNQVAWLGIVANAVIVPLVGLVVVPLGLAASILVLLGGLDHLPFASLQQAIMHVVTGFIEMGASIPGAKWHVASPSILAIAGFYLCFMVVLFSRKPILRWVNVSLLMLCLFWWMWSPRHVFEEDVLRVTFLDVGQGDATVLELPDGQTILVDGGVAYERWNMGRMVVGPYLWDQGIRRLDHVIATHPQLDHVGGLPWIVDNFEIGQYWSNGVRRMKPFYRRLETASQGKGLVERIAWEGQDIVNEGRCRLRSLNPPLAERSRIEQVSDRSGADLNNLSVVLSVTCGRHSILLMADAEVDTLTRLTGHPLIQSATVVKIPHHGAKSSLNQRWINQLQATSAVVSAGHGNHYGHPAQAVLGAYRRKHMRIYRTDSDGAIVLFANPDSGESRIQRMRDRKPVRLAWADYSLAREWENVFRLWNIWVRNA